MTNDEIRNLKGGDFVRYVCAACHTLCSATIQRVVSIGRDSRDADSKHRWARVVLDTGHTVTLESDEYIKSFGGAVFDTIGTRIAGAETMPKVWG